MICQLVTQLINFFSNTITIKNMICRCILFEILFIKQVSLNFDVRIDEFRIFCNSGSGVYCIWATHSVHLILKPLTAFHPRGQVGLWTFTSSFKTNKTQKELGKKIIPLENKSKACQGSKNWVSRLDLKCSSIFENLFCCESGYSCTSSHQYKRHQNSPAENF